MEPTTKNIPMSQRLRHGPEPTPIPRKRILRAVDVKRDETILKLDHTRAENGIAEQKTALLKRHQDDRETDLNDLILEWINEKLEHGKKVLAEYTFESEKEKQNYLFHNRCRILKPIKSKNILSEKFLISHWSKEIEYLKNNKFPYKWMENDPAISRMNRKHKPLMLICNFLRNMARNATESQKENMIRLSNETVHKTTKMKKQKDGTEKPVVNKWPVFCFKADRKFYKLLAEKIGYSEKTIQRYILAMTAFGILKEVNSIGKIHVLSFGYYVKHNGRHNFNHWLNKATYKDTLQDFQLCKYKRTDVLSENHNCPFDNLKITVPAY